MYKYSFLILEEKVKYNDDRSWCFWAEKESSLQGLISQSWKSFSFSYKKKEIIHFSNKYNYHYIRSIDFYDHVLKKIKKNSSVTLQLGERVISISSQNEQYLVYTNKKRYKAINIIDTRPRKNVYLDNPFLFQTFLGYEIVLKKGIYKIINSQIITVLLVTCVTR